MRKNPEISKFLEEFNEVLSRDPLKINGSCEPIYPTILVMGLPRSGTTLMCQIIAAGLNVGFIDSIAARFWEAPVYGLRLSKSISADKRFFSFESDYAAPRSPFEPHEFSYFWQKWMKTEYSLPTVGCHHQTLEIDWKGFVNTLGQIQKECGRAMLFKGMGACGNLKSLAKHVPYLIFVYVERNSLDVAASLLKARTHYYGNERTWWSLYPPEYHELVSRSTEEQVMGQVFYLKKHLDEELTPLIDVPIVRTSYEKLCRDPRSILNRIRALAKSFYAQDISFMHYSFPKFKPRKGMLPRSRQALLRKAAKIFKNIKKGDCL